MPRPTEPVFTNDRSILEVDLDAIVANRRLMMRHVEPSINTSGGNGRRRYV